MCYWRLSRLWSDPLALGVMTNIRAITLAQIQKYSKAGIVIRADLLKGKGKEKESKIHPGERDRQIGYGPKCTGMMRLWIFLG